ncbi:MAG: hypothetical protein U1E31_01595 [Rickettsiales bacterium]
MQNINVNLLEKLSNIQIIQQIIINKNTLTKIKIQYFNNPYYNLDSKEINDKLLSVKENKKENEIEINSIDTKLLQNNISNNIHKEAFKIIDKILNYSQYAFEDPFSLLPTITTIQISDNANFDKDNSSTILKNLNYNINIYNIIELKFQVIDLINKSSDNNFKQQNNFKEQLESNKINTSLFLNENDVIICDIITNLKKIDIFLIKLEQEINNVILEKNEQEINNVILEKNNKLKDAELNISNNELDIISLYIQLHDKFQMEYIFTVKYIIANILHIYKKNAQYI